MRCDLARQRLVDLLYDDIDPETRGLLEGHLAGCEACREEWASLAGTRQLLSGLPDEEPQRGLGPVLEAAREEAARGRRRWIAWSWRPALGAGLAAAATLAMVFLVEGGPPSRLEPSREPAPPAVSARAGDSAPQVLAPPASEAAGDEAVEPPRRPPAAIAPEAKAPASPSKAPSVAARGPAPAPAAPAPAADQAEHAERGAVAAARRPQQGEAPAPHAPSLGEAPAPSTAAARAKRKAARASEGPVAPAPAASGAMETGDPAPLPPSAADAPGRREASGAEVLRAPMPPPRRFGGPDAAGGDMERAEALAEEGGALPRLTEGILIAAEGRAESGDCEGALGLLAAREASGASAEVRGRAGWLACRCQSRVGSPYAVRVACERAAAGPEPWAGLARNLLREVLEPASDRRD